MFVLNDPAPHVAIYCRISLDATGQLEGVERQEVECRRYAEERGWRVTKVYADNSISATSGKVRPAFEDLLRDRPRRLIVWHTDRLVRRMPDLQRVLDARMNVWSVKGGEFDLSTPDGILRAEIMTSVAGFETRQKAQRQRAANRHRRENGKVSWPIRPFGFERDGSHRKEEAALLIEAYQMLDRGETVEAIRQRWEEEGMPTPKGNAWRHSSVLAVLKHPRNGGLLDLVTKTDREEAARDGRPEPEPQLAPANWEPILPAEEWRRITTRQRKLNMVGMGQGKTKGLVSGIAACGRCGEKVRLGRQPRTGRSIYASRCTHVTAPREDMDRAVRNALLRHLSSPAAILALGPSGISEAARRAAAEAPVLRRQLEDLGNLFKARTIDPAEYVRLSSDIRAELEPMEALAETANQPEQPWAGKSPAQLLAMWDDTASMSLVARRALIRSTFGSIELMPKSAGKRFKPSRDLRIRDHKGRIVGIPVEGDVKVARFR